MLGVAQWCFLAFCWAYISAYSPIAGWLASSDILGGGAPHISFNRVREKLRAA